MMDRMREWTNEEHVEFLNSIEASFVRAMFADGGVNTEEQQRDPLSQNDCLLRLDRFLPDSCDSTEDLPTQRRRSYTNSPPPSDSNRSRVVKTERTTRRLLRSQPYAHLQELQVVPRAVLRRRE